MNRAEYEAAVKLHVSPGDIVAVLSPWHHGPSMARVSHVDKRAIHLNEHGKFDRLTLAGPYGKTIRAWTPAEDAYVKRARALLDLRVELDKAYSAANARQLSVERLHEVRILAAQFWQEHFK